MATKQRILVVDDEPVNVLVLQGLLKNAGFEVESASSGEEARESVAERQPDLILLDIMMPGESGLETCRKLQESPATAGIPVIFLSCLDRVDNKIEGLNLGAVDYVAKPFHGPEVLARIRSHLGFSRQREQIIKSQSQRLSQVKQAQRAMLVGPEELPQANFSVAYIPTLEAGGDFYDVVDLGSGRIGYLVADVSGHDLGASFLTSSLKALFRQNARPEYTAAQTLRHINEVLRGITLPEKFLTAAYAVLDRGTGKVDIALAGHPAPVLLSVDGDPVFLKGEGDILGVFSEIELGELELPVNPGDRIVLYTDGLVETKGISIAPENLLKLFVSGRSLPLKEAAEGIVAEIYGYSIPEDDVLVLTVEV
ncbi:MAG: PP2C family protein-serine/threonine phosphatase [Desulfovibrio sp.]